MKIIRMFLLIGCVSLNGLAQADSQQALIDIAHKYLTEKLLELSLSDIEYAVNEVQKYALNEHEALEQLKGVVESDITYCQQQIGKRDTYFLIASAVSLGLSVACFGVARAVDRKWCTPRKKEIDAFCEKNGITRITYDKTHIISCDYADDRNGEWVPGIHGTQYRFPIRAHRISENDERELFRLARRYDDSFNIEAGWGAGGLLGCAGTVWGVYEWLKQDYQKQYDKWCLVKQIIENELAKRNVL